MHGIPLDLRAVERLAGRAFQVADIAKPQIEIGWVAGSRTVDAVLDHALDRRALRASKPKLVRAHAIAATSKGLVVKAGIAMGQLFPRGHPLTDLLHAGRIPDLR